MLKKVSKKGFTLIEILASIAILAVVILLVTISYSKIRKNTLNKQYENLKTLVEQVAIKYSAKTGAYNFFVQDLIDENYLEPDDENNIYDPRDKSSMNCRLVTISDEEPISATLHEENHVTNGKCDSSDVEGYSSLLTLSAKLSGTDTIYTPTSTVNSSTIYPFIYNGWTKENIDITPDVAGITENLDNSYIVWNSIPENKTYYPNLGFTTDESVIYDDFYYADLYLSNDNRYQARIKYKMDKEKPVIYHDKTAIAKSTSQDKWVKSRVIVLYATDKDGVGLDRIYVGPRPCTDLLSDLSIGQAAIPGLVQTYTYTGEASEEGINANVCAVDKLGNLADSGSVFVSKIDSMPPNVITDVYVYNDSYGSNFDSYTTRIGQVTNDNVDISSYHANTGGWTNTGHYYKFAVNDGIGIGLQEGDIALFSSNGSGSYTLSNVLSNISVLRAHSSSTVSMKYFGAWISAKGRRIGSFEICDKLDNCRTIRINNEDIDKDAPSAPSTSSTYFTNAYGTKYSSGWTNEILYSSRVGGSTDLGSGVSNYQISLDGANSTFINYNYNNSTSSTSPYIVNQEGSVKRYFRAVDKVGNVGQALKVEGSIDTGAPTNVTYQLRYNSSSGAIRENADTWSNQNIWWGNFSATDPVSGIKEYQYNSGANCNNTSVQKFNYSSYTYTNGENTTFCFRAADNAGNTSEWQKVYIKVDTEAPTNVTYQLRYNNSSGVIRINADTWSNQNLWWGNFSAADPVSGVKQYEYNSGANCNNTADGVLSSSSYTYTNGENTTFCFRASDNAGNKSEWQKIYAKVDTVGPTVTIETYDYNASATNYVGTYRNSSSFTGVATLNVNDVLGETPTSFKSFKVTATDSLSGVVDHVDWNRDVEYNTNSWPSNAYERTDTGTLPYYNNFNVSGYRMAEAVVQDEAGNETRVTVMSATNVGSSSGGGNGGGGTGSGGSCTPDLTKGILDGHAAQNSCTNGSALVTSFGRMWIFGCKTEVVDQTFNVPYDDFNSYFTKGASCVPNSSGIYSVIEPKVKMKAMDQKAYYGYKCTNNTVLTCGNGKQYASPCSSSDGYYRYDNSKRYKCTQFRNGEEYAYAVSGQTSNVYLCCK